METLVLPKQLLWLSYLSSYVLQACQVSHIFAHAWNQDMASSLQVSEIVESKCHVYYAASV